MSAGEAGTPWRAIALAIVAATVVMMALDLVFLGVVARDLYDAWLGPLKRREVHWPAALAFYAMYVGAIVRHAILGAPSRRIATRRGAELGFVAYATYELTNWAVIEGWPAALVPVDLAWGVLLTGLVAGAGHAAFERASGPARTGARSA